MRVSPFRHLRIHGHLLLPAAFRSLSRLSSALSAKASTLCSFLLDLCEALLHCSSCCIALQHSSSSACFCISSGCLFSDVLIFKKILLFHQFCMKFSRYIRRLVYQPSEDPDPPARLRRPGALITGNPAYMKSPEACFLSVLAAACFPMPSPA